MGQVLHGSATTTEAVRRAIQHSQESLRIIDRRQGVNQKTAAKMETGVRFCVYCGWNRTRDGGPEQ